MYLQWTLGNLTSQGLSSLALPSGKRLHNELENLFRSRKLVTKADDCWQGRHVGYLVQPLQRFDGTGAIVFCIFTRGYPIGWNQNIVKPIYSSLVYIYIYYIIHLLYPICWYLKHGESPLFEEYRHVPASWQPGYSPSRPPFVDFDGRNTPIKNGNVEAKIAVELGKQIQNIWENMGWTPKTYENIWTDELKIA